MNTLHLKYVLEVERTGSITQAADNLFMAQPNLSKAIKELEDTVGVTIFRRSPKGVLPTKEGTEFLFHARKILRQVEYMEQIGKRASSAVPPVSVAIPMDSEYLIRACAAYAALPHSAAWAGISLLETEATRAIRGVAEEEYRLGVVRCRSVQEAYYTDLLAARHIEFEILRVFEMEVFMSKRHPLAEAGSIAPEQLEAYTEVACAAPANIEGGEREYAAGSAAQGGRIVLRDLAARLDILNAVPTAYMWSPPLPQRQLDSCGLVRNTCGCEKYQDLLIYPQDYKLSEEETSFVFQAREAQKNTVR